MELSLGSPSSAFHHAARREASGAKSGSLPDLWHTCRMPELEDLLREASLHVTRPRVAVLAAVYEHPHADTYSIIGDVRRELGGVSQQAVYDVLNALTDAGLLRRIQPRGSVARYESRVADNH